MTKEIAVSTGTHKSVKCGCGTVRIVSRLVSGKGACPSCGKVNAIPQAPPPTNRVKAKLAPLPPREENDG